MVWYTRKLIDFLKNSMTNSWIFEFFFVKKLLTTLLCYSRQYMLPRRAVIQTKYYQRKILLTCIM